MGDIGVGGDSSRFWPQVVVMMRLLFPVLYFAVLSLLVVPLRLLLAAFNAPQCSSAMQYVDVACGGVWQDMTIAACAAIVPLLLAVAGLFTKISFKRAMLYCNAAVALLVAFSFIADAILCPVIGGRLNFAVLMQYADAPEQIMEHFSAGYLFTRFALLVAATTFLTLLLHRITPEKPSDASNRTVAVAVYAVMLVAFVLVIRTGICSNVPQECCGGDAFLKSAAVNPIFNMIF